MSDAVDIAEQFEKHLNSPKQTWLLGAGVSCASNIPLMRPLTERVLEVANTVELVVNDEGRRIIAFIQNDIEEDANIEEFLTHLGDFISMADRSRTGCALIGGQLVPKEDLVLVHHILLRIIAETVRWGFKPATFGDNGEEIEAAEVGENGKGIVGIKEHSNFVKSLFDAGRAGLEMIRTPVEFFTTNYDTLLEDALALHQIDYEDGFSGGGLGFWMERNYQTRDTTRAIVTKTPRFRRTGIGLQKIRPHCFECVQVAHIPVREGVVMIYPQATKYLNVQRDPFSELFQRFRRRLVQGVDQVLLICGYSFSDEHN